MSAGLFALSIDPNLFKDNFTKKLFWGTSYGQHLSGKFSGLASLNSEKIISDSRPGLFAPNFKDRMNEFMGTEAIGYCGPAEEPLYVEKSKVGSFSACFCGNIRNRVQLVEEFLHSGLPFKREDDIVVMTDLIIQGTSVVDGIRWMTQKIDGAYALLVITPEGIYVACCPTGHWPLVIGEKKGAVIVASECIGFNNLGFKRIRDIEPGEIVLLRNGVWTSLKDKLPQKQVQKCTFYGDYTSFVNAIVHELPASWIRKKLGAALARRDIATGFIPHIVMPVPDSGRFHAVGYYQEYVRQIMLGNIKRIPFYDEYLSKYGIVRSFLEPIPEEQREKAHYKIVISGETVEYFIRMLEEAGLTEIVEDIKSNGRIIVVINDDSIVRGTQTKSDLAPKVRLIFEKKVDGIDIKAEIHLRVSYPELLSHCPHGKTTKKGETLAELLPKKADRIKELGIEGLEYNTVGDLFEIIGCPPEELCVDCARHRE